VNFISKSYISPFYFVYFLFSLNQAQPSGKVEQKHKKQHILARKNAVQIASTQIKSNTNFIRARQNKKHSFDNV